MKKPNIILITSDQQRKDSLGSYNENICTDTLDALAKDGLVMERAYITHPTCTPSRASILTGQMASKHGAYTIGTALSEDAVKFSDFLKSADYDTCFIGKPHFQHLSDPSSFEWSGRAADEAFWSNYEGGYFGFDKTRIYNGHTSYPFTAGMHYRVWLKEKGLTDEEISERFHYKPCDTFREHGEWKIEKEYHPTTFTAEQAAAYIQERESDKPYMMWVSFSDPHDPHVVPEPYASMYSPDEADYLGYVEGEHDNRPKYYRQLYENGLEGLEFNDEFGVPSTLSGKTFGDEKYFREVTALHHGMVKFMDDEIAKIMDALKARGEYDDTLIIFTTDHGDYLGNHGYIYKGFPAFEEVYNVPMIVKLPKNVNAGMRVSNLVSHIDIAPTLLEAAGLDRCEEMDGVSQWRFWNGQGFCPRAYAEVENRPVTEGFYQKMVITDRYKLVVYMDDLEGELYDLKRDPDQYENLWKNEKFTKKKLRLLGQIAKNPELGDEQSLLSAIWQAMHDEKVTQRRTSYS